MAGAVSFDLAALARVVPWLRREGYRPVGPVVRDGSIAYDELPDDWSPPIGLTLEQSPGRARLRARDDGAAFGWVPGADSWKRFLFPPSEEVVRGRLTDDGWTLAAPRPPERPLALVAARACELRAVAVLDRVFLAPEHRDPRYAARRRALLVVAVDCGEPGGTCACVSRGGWPRPESDVDVRLSELPPRLGAPPRFVAVAGSERGAALLATLDAVPATADEVAAADQRVADAAERMGTAFPTTDLPARLAQVLEHPRWDEIGERCLACGSCTLVCPTCFCGTFRDVTGPADGLAMGELARRHEWASCFQADHSLLGPGPVRSSTASRYRQWLTHKLGTWDAQFGTSGCVGCGRCTTWCPVGIDLAAEATALTEEAR